MIACADLLERGFFVFRNVSHHGPADLIAMSKAGKLQRVEVKQGRISWNGKHLTIGKTVQVESDLVAIVSQGKLFYFKPKTTTLYRTALALELRATPRKRNGSFEGERQWN